MTKILFDIQREVGKDEMERYQEIFTALIATGGLTGIKAGKTIINFDNEGNFQGIQFDYWPWRRRKVDKS